MSFIRKLMLAGGTVFEDTQMLYYKAESKTNKLNFNSSIISHTYDKNTKEGKIICKEDITEIIFKDYTNLEEINIPTLVTSINTAYTTYTNVSIGKINVSSIEQWCNITHNTINANPLSNSAKLYINNEKLTELIIPDSITSLKSYCFANSDIESLDLNNVNEIGYASFKNCKNLITVDLPNSINNIDSYTFGYCTNLKYINLENIINIETEAFCECTNLENITLSEELKTLGDSCFKNCSKIKVNLPSTLETIGSQCFKYCEGFTNINIENIKNIGTEAFAYCPNLEYVKISTVNAPNGFSGTSLFTNCTNLKEVDLNLTNTSLAGWFSHCSNLDKINLLGEYKTIGQSAFEYCTKIKEFTIPNGVNTIERYAFRGCNLSKIIIPNSLYRIKSQLPSTGDIDIYIPSIENWINMNFEKDFYVGGSEDSSFNLYANNELVTEISMTIDGSNTISDYMFAYNRNITKVSISTIFMQSNSSIGKNAFYKCTGLNELSFSGPADIIIGDNAFGACSIKTLKLSSIETWLSLVLDHKKYPIVNRNTDIYINGELATTIEIPSGITELNRGVFRNFKDLIEVTIPSTIKTTSEYCFSGCSALKTVNLSEGVEILHNYSFENCGELENITFPTTLTNLYSEVFVNASKLLSLTFLGSRPHTNLLVFKGMSENGVVYHKAEYDFSYFFEKTELKHLNWTEQIIN